MSMLGKLFQKSYRLALSTLSGIAKGILNGFYKAIGPRGIELMVMNNWHTIPLLLTAFDAPSWRYPDDLSREEVARLEALRKRLAPAVKYGLVLAKSIASMVPPSTIEEKLDKGWIERRLMEANPEILTVIKSMPNGEKWLEEEAELLKKFLLGRM